MADQQWWVPYIPQLATGILGYAAARLAHRAKKEEVSETTASQVQIARIEATSSTEGHLWAYLKDSNDRHEIDIVRLNDCNDKRRAAESEIVVLRSRLANALREIRHLRKQNNNGNRQT